MPATTMMQTIKARFTSAGMRTALNTALTTQALQTLPAAILPHTTLLAFAAALPALAVEIPRWELGRTFGGHLHEVLATVELTLAFGGDEEAGLRDDALAYADVVRAVVEQQLDAQTAGFNRLTCVGAEPEGTRFDNDILPTRLVAVRFRVEALYTEGVV